MKTAEKMLQEHWQSDDVHQFDECYTTNDVISLMKSYAYEAISDAINKTEICCNNFNPTITLKQLVDIKNNLP